MRRLPPPHENLGTQSVTVGGECLMGGVGVIHANFVVPRCCAVKPGGLPMVGGRGRMMCRGFK